MGNSLVEVPLDDWKELRTLFKTDWPRHILPYLAIENYERLKSTHKPNTKIYCLDGDWSDGTFILQDGTTATIYTLQKSCQRLYEALLLCDWSVGKELHPYDVAHKSVIDKIRIECNLKYPTDYIEDGQSTMYWMSQEKALELDDSPPDDCVIRDLEDKDSTMINNLWPHGTPESESYIKLMIAINPSRGIYGKQNGELRSWILSHTNGVLLALQTSPEYLRKGYGAITLKSMAKLKAKLGQDTVGCVVPANINSHNLFNKLNFTKIDDKYWTRLGPYC